MNDTETFRGMTGFVKAKGKIAHKYSLLDDMYWLREYSVLLYLKSKITQNIIKFNDTYISERYDKESDSIKYYFDFEFPRYEKCLDVNSINSERDIIQILLDLSSAVACLHSEGIMHRDIKPQNIMIMNITRPRAILIDFSHSIRKKVNLLVPDSSVVTCYYRSPEVYKYIFGDKCKYNEKIDCWSLGIILYEILTKKKLLIGCAEELMYKELSDRNTFMKKVKDNISLSKNKYKYIDDYIIWINALLEYDVSKRISASSLYDKILKFAKHVGLDIVIPINFGKVIKQNNLIVINLSPDRYPLYQDCTNFVTNYFRYISIRYNSFIVNRIIGYLIYLEELQKNNKYAMTTAIVIVVSLLHNDDFNDITFTVENIIELSHDMGESIELKISDVRECMITLMSKYDIDLIADDLFDMTGDGNKSQILVDIE
jgi:serine/threonine protein kinase